MNTFLILMIDLLKMVTFFEYKLILIDLTSDEKATIFYLRGKVLDINPDYNKQAEEALSNSIKLNPYSWKTWDVLGHMLWKKQNYTRALESYEEALEKVNYI